MHENFIKNQRKNRKTKIDLLNENLTKRNLTFSQLFALNQFDGFGNSQNLTRFLSPKIVEAYFSKNENPSLPIFCYLDDFSEKFGEKYCESLVLLYQIPTFYSIQISYLIIPTFSKEPILFDKRTNFAILKQEITKEGLEFLDNVLRFAKMVQKKVLEEMD